MEGYLSLLVGQQVPYRRTYTPDEQAIRTWEGIKLTVRDKVAQAYTVREALQVIRLPYWTWPKGIYDVPMGANR